jgi:hypothetical protein
VRPAIYTAKSMPNQHFDVIAVIIVGILFANAGTYKKITTFSGVLIRKSEFIGKMAALRYFSEIIK